jgi:hypothetical protein
LRPSLPPEVDIWVERGLAIDPNDRFRTCGASFGELLWALNLAPHPSQQRRVRLPEATIVGMRAFLDSELDADDDEAIEELTVLSMEPEPLDDEDVEEGTVLDSLPLLSLGPLASEAPRGETSLPSGLGPLPPIPQAPPMPGGLEPRPAPTAPPTEASAVHAVGATIPATPKGRAERSGATDLEDEPEDATTFYAHPDLWIESQEG